MIGGKEKILAIAKLLKEVEKFKKMFVSPDLTGKQQTKHTELRRQLKLIPETGVTGTRIKNRKVIKIETGGREIVTCVHGSAMPCKGRLAFPTAKRRFSTPCKI
jgi:hypothetical protein